MSAIYLIRHGQASFGEADYDTLSETGLRQSQVLGAALAQRLVQPASVVCGDMLRHRQTARACMMAVDATTEWRTDPRWNEVGHERIISAYRPEFADHDTMRRELMRSEDPPRAFQALFEAALARWMSGEHDADYTETWPMFRARCRAAFDDLVARLGPRSDALVFTSGGPISVIVMELLGVPAGSKPAFAIVNASLTKLIVGRQGNVSLATLNDYAHFEAGHAGLVTYR